MTQMDTQDFKRPAGLTKRMEKFALNKIRGMGDEEAAIAADVSPNSARTTAYRWKNHPAVKEFLEDIYMSELRSYQTVVANVINVWRDILNDKNASHRNKLEAGKLLKEFFDQMVDGDIRKIVMGRQGSDSNAIPYKTMLEYLTSTPAPERRVEDFLDQGDD